MKERVKCVTDVHLKCAVIQMLKMRQCWVSCLSSHIILCCLVKVEQGMQYGPRREKTCLREFVNNTGADQPVHPSSLISAFVIRFLESIICNLATGEISIF